MLISLRGKSHKQKAYYKSMWKVHGQESEASNRLMEWREFAISCQFRVT